jgi:HPt (histidine-containing phosphotransfer) domain-containing protein
MSAVPVDIERLNLITGGDPELIRELVDLFIGDANDRITLLSASIASGELDAVKRQAHAIKGAAANMGAELVQGVCHSIEQALASGASTAELSRLNEQLAEAMAATVAYFRAI